jgi:IclR family acetate operon transcriptional repressor
VAQWRDARQEGSALSTQARRGPAEASGVKQDVEISSIEKGLRLLRVLAGAPDGMSPSEVAALSGLNRSTTYRVLEILERGDWIQPLATRDGTRRVGIGATMLGLSILITNTFDTTARLQPIIDRLAASVGETVHVGVLEQSDVVHIARAVPDSRTPFAAELGGRDAAHVTALGKALMSMIPREEIRRMYPSQALPTRTPSTIGTVDELLVELDRVVAHGYAVDDEESRAGVRCVAAPVFGLNDRLVFAVSITSAPARLEGDALENAIASVKGCAALLTTSFGGSLAAARRAAAIWT